jgi:hypothetical protein
MHKLGIACSSLLFVLSVAASPLRAQQDNPTDRVPPLRQSANLPAERQSPSTTPALAKRAATSSRMS